MAVDIPFTRDLDFEYGRSDQVTPLIRRVIANNPSPFTCYGTGTYIVGRGQVAVIDPGPQHPEHLKALLSALEGEQISHIFVTHTHTDHSPLAGPLQAATGAPTLGFGGHGLADGSGGGIKVEGGSNRSGNARAKDAPVIEEGADLSFRPDHVLDHGDVIKGPGWTLEAVHTPGHTSNHLCYALAEEKVLFSGDHVMGWSTSVISPPDGNMADYLNSLRMLLQRGDSAYWPTHGPRIDDPKTLVRAFIAHRAEREEQIAACLAAGVEAIGAMVERIYPDLPRVLRGAAARSVLAHLIHMVEAGRARSSGSRGGSPSLDSRFQPG